MIDGDCQTSFDWPETDLVRQLWWSLWYGETCCWGGRCPTLIFALGSEVTYNAFRLGSSLCPSIFLLVFPYCLLILLAWVLVNSFSGLPSFPTSYHLPFWIIASFTLFVGPILARVGYAGTQLSFFSFPCIVASLTSGRFLVREDDAMHSGWVNLICHFSLSSNLTYSKKLLEKTWLLVFMLLSSLSKMPSEFFRSSFGLKVHMIQVLVCLSSKSCLPPVWPIGHLSSHHMLVFLIHTHICINYTS